MRIVSLVLGNWRHGDWRSSMPPRRPARKVQHQVSSACGTTLFRLPKCSVPCHRLIYGDQTLILTSDACVTICTVLSSYQKLAGWLTAWNTYRYAFMVNIDCVHRTNFEWSKVNGQRFGNPNIQQGTSETMPSTAFSSSFARPFTASVCRQTVVGGYVRLFSVAATQLLSFCFAECWSSYESRWGPTLDVDLTNLGNITIWLGKRAANWSSFFLKFRGQFALLMILFIVCAPLEVSIERLWFKTHRAWACLASY